MNNRRRRWMWSSGALASLLLGAAILSVAQTPRNRSIAHENPGTLASLATQSQSASPEGSSVAAADHDTEAGVSQPLQVVPRRLNFGELTSHDEAVERTVRIRHVHFGADAPRITCDSPGLAVSVVAYWPTPYGIDVTVALRGRPAYSGRVVESATIEYEGRKARVHVRGRISGDG